MKCEDFGKYLDNYENLTEFQKSEMTDHAANCEACKAELDFFLSVIATAKTLPKLNPPPDFMDKLNARLDAEEKKAYMPRRIVYHVSRNWKQYAAAAACFALLAVLTANRGTLLDGMDRVEDGVIGEETVAANDTSTSQSAAESPAAPAENTADNAPVTNENTAGGFDAFAEIQPPSVTRNSSYDNTQVSETASVSRPASVRTAQVPSASSNTIETAANNTSDTESTRSAAERVLPEKNGDDYGIALAGTIESMMSSETASVAYDLRPEEVSASLRASEIKENYSLADGGESIALGRYYIIDKDGNPIEEDSEPKAIGSLRVSSSDAEKAMDVIRQYPHGEDGNVYTTNSENLSSILSELSDEGVEYTDYTLSGSGDIKFRIEFD